jgi:hypothetical protein
MRDQASEIERAVDASAAALLAVATAFCCARLSLGLPGTGAAFLASFGLGFAALRAVRPEEPAFRIGDFAPADTEDFESDSTIDREADVEADVPNGSPELLLDDVLAELAPDSRVVRLFDPATMPTPAELQARIKRHLGSDYSMPAQAQEVDASEALHEALAELRRSLR